MLRHVLSVLVLVALVPRASAAQTVDELLAKNFAAKGGLEKIRAVQTMRLAGSMPVGPKQQADFVMEMKRPNQMRMDFTFGSNTVTQAFDGKIGWQLLPPPPAPDRSAVPATGRPQPQVMPAEALKDLEAQADMDGPLVDYQAKGHKVEYVGREKVEGTDTYVLKVTLKTGDVRRIYLDAEQYLEIRSEGKSRGPDGREVEIETLIGDYREVGGLMLPHSHESGLKGSPEKRKMTIQKIEINVPVDDARFKMPK